MLLVCFDLFVCLFIFCFLLFFCVCVLLSRQSVCIFLNIKIHIGACVFSYIKATVSFRLLIGSALFGATFYLITRNFYHNFGTMKDDNLLQPHLDFL